MLITRKLRDVAVVQVAKSKAEFEQLLTDNKFDVLLMDHALPGFIGSESISMAEKLNPSTPIILVTGSISHAAARAACRSNVKDFIIKGEEYERLPVAVQGAYEKVLKDRENEKLKMQSIKNQRLEVIGDLSSAVVHDINGILQIFVMGTAALRDKVKPSDGHILDLMEGASKRGGELTAQILAFARGSNGAKFKDVTAEYIVSEVGAIMRRTFPPNIRTSATTEIGTGSVRGDSTQLIQVLVNLVTNSRDALSPKGGEIRLLAQNMSRSEGMDGSSIMFTVADNGTGIPPESMPMIWEPFWSSKPVNKGTGLGLPTVKRIVEDHHGVITVESEIAKGTTFRVLIPIAATSSVKAQAANEELDDGEKTVMLVDDDKSILELTQMLLENAGYKVVTAANGPEAMNWFRGPHQIDVLITDLSMPIMSGDQLVQGLRAQGFRLPVIFLSGYDSPVIPDTGDIKVLRKPVSRETLLAVLRDVLDIEILSA